MAAAGIPIRGNSMQSKRHKHCVPGKQIVWQEYFAVGRGRAVYEAARRESDYRQKSNSELCLES